MRPTLLGCVLGWLISCWVQVPLPVQTGLKTIVHWITVKVSNKVSLYETKIQTDARKGSILEASAGPE